MGSGLFAETAQAGVKDAYFSGGHGTHIFSLLSLVGRSILNRQLRIEMGGFK